MATVNVPKTRRISLRERYWCDSRQPYKPEDTRGKMFLVHVWSLRVGNFVTASIHTPTTTSHHHLLYCRSDTAAALHRSSRVVTGTRASAAASMTFVARMKAGLFTAAAAMTVLLASPVVGQDNTTVSCVQIVQGPSFSSCPCDEASFSFTMEGQTSVAANTVSFSLRGGLYLNWRAPVYGVARLLQALDAALLLNEISELLVVWLDLPFSFVRLFLCGEKFSE